MVVQHSLLLLNSKQQNVRFDSELSGKVKLESCFRLQDQPCSTWMQQDYPSVRKWRKQIRGLQELPLTTEDGIFTVQTVQRRTEPSSGHAAENAVGVKGFQSKNQFRK